jgi:hypothetical protein
MDDQSSTNVPTPVVQTEAAPDARFVCARVLSEVILMTCKGWDSALRKYAENPAADPPDFLPRTADGLQKVVDLLNALSPAQEATVPVLGGLPSAQRDPQSKGKISNVKAALRARQSDSA